MPLTVAIEGVPEYLTSIELRQLMQEKNIGVIGNVKKRPAGSSAILTVFADEDVAKLKAIETDSVKWQVTVQKQAAK